jgi:hypothetical protein
MATGQTNEGNSLNRDLPNDAKIQTCCFVVAVFVVGQIGGARAFSGHGAKIN